MDASDLINAGFKHYPSRGDVLQRYDDLFQIKVTDSTGTRYFLNVYRWDHTKHGWSHIGWEAELVSNDGATWWGEPFWIKTSCKGKSAADVIRWGEELWERLALNYYERNG